MTVKHLTANSRVRGFHFFSLILRTNSTPKGNCTKYIVYDYPKNQRAN